MINISISTNLLIIISSVILVAIIGLIVYIIYKDKMIDQEEIDDLIEDIVKAKPREKENKEEIKVTKIETTEAPTKLNLEAMLNDMQNNLEKKQKKSIEEYEREQDDTAIISIKDLEKSNVSSIDAYEKEQEDTAIININELKKFNSMDTLTEKEEELVRPVKKAITKIETNNKKSKFKSTDFISPIFGKMDSNIEYPTIKSYEKLNEEYIEEKAKHASLEQSIGVEPLSDEIKRNTEFLKALKEFRNNL